MSGGQTADAVCGAYAYMMHRCRLRLVTTEGRRKMSIVIVGGHDRMHCKYKEICKKYGCKCKVFTQCPANFKNQIGNPDMVVVFTGTVAHKMVSVASQQAEKAGAYIKHCHSSSGSALDEALKGYFEETHQSAVV